MKLLKSFLSLLVFSLMAAFSSLYAQSPPEKIVVLKTKSAKISPKQVTTNAAPNFVRTDALVFYENAFAADPVHFESEDDDESVAPCSPNFDTETFFVSYFADSKFFGPAFSGKWFINYKI